MRGDSAQLPVDFLVGFTIFILSLIMVANFVPSLLVGLQRTSGIDYNAVAYRTGVVLVEDPGETNPPQKDVFPIGGNPFLFAGMDWRPWELMGDVDQVSRFGLAVSRDTPNILSVNKVRKFFGCTTFSYSGDLQDNDYRKRLLFSSYQYGYNITLQNISPMKPGTPPLKLSIGEPYPEGYGYIRRYVAIKQNSNATQNLGGLYHPYHDTLPGNESLVCLSIAPLSCVEQFRIRLNGTMLYNRNIDIPYKIDLQREPLVVNITGLSTFLNHTDRFAENGLAIGNFNRATLNKVEFESPSLGWTSTSVPGGVRAKISIDGGVPVDLPLGAPVTVIDSLSIAMDYVDAGYFGDGRDLNIIFTFRDLDPLDPSLYVPGTLIHGEFLYDYNRTNVTQPVLSTGMLEVGVW